jgi:hypothetical protein
VIFWKRFSHILIHREKCTILRYFPKQEAAPEEAAPEEEAPEGPEKQQ